MSNQNTTTPAIEDVIREKLTAQAQQNALNYVAYLKANGITPNEPETFDAAAHTQCFFGSDNGSICILGIDHCPPEWGFSTCGGWDNVLFRNEYQDFPVDEKVKEFAWAHACTCRNYKSNGKQCGCGFQPGRRISMFGKDFYHACHGGLDISNPDGETLELAKKFTVVLKQIMADAAKDDKPYVPGENEWLSVKGNGAPTGRPLGKVYTKTLDVQFYITSRRRYAWDAAVGFSDGEMTPATWQQIPVALRFGDTSRIEAYKGPSEGWRTVEALKYQANVPYFIDMSINIADNIYNATAYMLDTFGKPDTPYCIAKDFPFRHDTGDPAITAIDTIYHGPSVSGAYIIRDFKVVGGE